MKISVEWLKAIGGKGLSIPTTELVERIGSQLGAVEGTVHLGAKYKNILIAKVIECTQHPNADRLSICKIDDGRRAKNVARDDSGYVQVVCGAPNVEQNLMVAWLPPGTTVPVTYNTTDPLVIEARNIRGQKSSGMLASPKELAIGDGHEGLLVIDKSSKPGDSFAELYNLNDQIIDIENKMFTHRPDCFGMLGVAREVTGIQNLPYTSPDWYLNPNTKLNPVGDYLPLNVKNEIPELVPRFMAIVLRDVSVGPSPVWLQSYLSRVGVRPISNIVDVTNYMMLLSGQPLHAYDYDKIKAQDKGADSATIVVRRPKPEEKIVLLGGKEISLDGPEIVIATSTTAIGLGGVMGGLNTEVDDQTKNIILECATFDMYTIRRTSMLHGLFTDAVTRFTKGQSPRQNKTIIIKSANMILELAGKSASYASDLIDTKDFEDTTICVSVAVDFINSRLGLKLDAVLMQKVLQNVEFRVEVVNNNLNVWPPFWRTDINISEDIVEEIGRLYGYDHLPLQLPKRSLKPVAKDALLDLKSQLRSVLSGAGANELLTYSFVHGKLFERVNQDSEKALQLNNALSPDLQYYRLSLTPSLLEKVYPNLRSNYVRNDDNEFVLYEINKTHNTVDRDKQKLPKEWESLALVFAADAKTANRKYLGAAYYAAKKYLSYILIEDQLPLSIVPLSEVAKTDLEINTWTWQLVMPFDPDRSAVVIDELGKIRGVVGEYASSVKQQLKLPAFCSGFELDITVLQNRDRVNKYIAIPRFPKVEQDVTLRVPSSLKYSDLFEFMWDSLNSDKPKDTFCTLGPIDIFQKDKDPDHKQVSLRLWISAFDRTLTADIVNDLLDKASEKAKKKFGAERI